MGSVKDIVNPYTTARHCIHIIHAPKGKMKVARTCKVCSVAEANLIGVIS